VNIILPLDHPEGSVNKIIRILVKFLLRKILKLLGYLLRKLLFTTLLAFKADCEFCLAACPRTAGDLNESLLIFRMDTK
jgi:hypothetical protein